ncbi:N-6 DNA methylase [Neglectibacter timonensis]|uniref:site-specific DNA-methyltransferase (adenine-specific) n=1 Tax=Neglectibacter timonensis TaxID=1776382 RepID=A0ABT1S482_9FIRM|nr:DNA methyltransferase [Neglectibacter timonensis]MCQ4841595.1 N-6 DNA methylase [Neglectibacter timonensis]MCQ4845275.1 N-6 DNA methylase [Neglectibacter timonensis]
MVYIGADKYEISAFNEDAVSLQNVEFPLFGKEFSRADFEEKLRENPANDHLKVVVTETQKTETPSEKKPDSVEFAIGFSEHPAFYDREFHDRYTNLSFALGNRLLGRLDEKQHRERESKEYIGWYHKTDFKISATVDGEDFNYEGRFDIGDGEGDLIAHIKNFYDYALSPKGEQLYGEEQEELRRGRDKLVPFLTQHSGLNLEDEKLLAEIMATEGDWYKAAEEETPRYTVEQTSDAFDEPFIIRDNTVPDMQDGRYYDVGGIYQTFDNEKDAQKIADNLNGTNAPEQSTDDLIGKEMTIDNRRYLIESVSEISGDVSMRDITFQNNVGFPINRVEKLSRVREWLDRQEQAEILPEKEKADTPATPTYSDDRRNYRITDDALGVGGAKEKFKANMAAIHLLHDLEIENRLATPVEQETLSKYVGWGGLSAAFDANNAAWTNEYQELKGVLSTEEYRAAMESTLTAFYTPPVVIKAVYEALDRMGFSEGNILDPACGSGNFLTETYISLRRLENEVLRILSHGQISFGDAVYNPIQVSIGQFYGIEINDFAVTVAKTALWIAESQMMKETEEIVLMHLEFLPLKSYTNIIEGNALQINWEDTVPKYKLSYIMGNPPFVGYSLQSKEQKNDILSIYIDEKGKPYKTAGKIDYVSGWYFKAAQFMQGTNIRTAFVSTNSITQGEQVAGVWKPLYDRFNVHIDFAHRTFIWDSEASLKAHVHCVIVGFSTDLNTQKRVLYSSDRFQIVDNINAYLVDAPDVFIESRSLPICNVPKMTTGNRPADGGNLIIESSDYDDFIKQEPGAKKYIKRLMGAKEYINNQKRYCLWLVGISPAELRKMPFVLERVEACRQDRLNGAEDRQKLADTPTLFREVDCKMKLDT